MDSAHSPRHGVCGEVYLWAIPAVSGESGDQRAGRPPGGSEAQGLVTKAVAADKKSKFTYRLTEKGVDTVPIIVELLLWGAKHGPTVVAPGLLEELQAEKDAAVAKYQRLAREQALT